MTSSASVDCVVANQNQLGESPVWCERADVLYWVDSRGPRLYSYAPSTGKVQEVVLHELVGSVALCIGDRLLLALQSGLHLFELGTLSCAPFAPLESELPENRLNDGRADRAGRFWVGSMSDVRRAPVGSLYRVTGGGAATRMLSEVIVPNSIAWSPDDRTMYFADTYRDVIWSFDFDSCDGTLSNQRVFQDTSDRRGRPDGSTVDADGCLWNAEYGGGRVVRYTPQGRIDRVVELPVSNPTCCTFGGSGLATLFITSAAQRLTAEQRALEPLAGSVFALVPGVLGIPEGRFAQ